MVEPAAHHAAFEALGRFWSGAGPEQDVTVQAPDQAIKTRLLLRQKPLPKFGAMPIHSGVAPTVKAGLGQDPRTLPRAQG